MLTSSALSCRLLHSQLPLYRAFYPPHSRLHQSISRHCNRSGGRLRQVAGEARAMASDSSPDAHQPFMGPGSENLRSQSCGGSCSRETPRLTDAELDAALLALPGWRADSQRASITRSFVAKNFVKAVEYFGRVAEVAEAEGHHPDLHLTNFRDVSITVSTHVVGGITQPDIILAAKLDAVPAEYSPKWLRENTP